ncbi:MAG: DUF2723 domain-containing protein [Flavipsychrobacter sp.]|nr:DUF2723 domain-containing protein [Flavipsychrobacter sp.]
MNYRKINNIVGWATGLIALAVYLMTMERTVSFWDCGEFASCAYKLEVGHSPGAPFFMMLQRLFGILAGGTTGQPSTSAIVFINAMSAVMSAGTILFLFWTITHFAKKLIAGGSNEPTGQQNMLIMGAGLVGGLAYTFSDTFWFSAVEAEVYATSSFFTALVFWAILKWENVANERHGDRWLVFIAYLTGLSVGVHLLNLLTIPAIAMVYYYKRYEATTRGAILAFILGCLVLAFVQFGVIQYLPIFASKFDLMFVNDLGMPFDSGAIAFVVLLVGLLVWLLMLARKKQWYLVHTSLLCICFIIIGFSAYLAPIIRSRADVPIDMTNPDNTLSLISYVQREQYGQQPLFVGPDYTSDVIDKKVKGYNYTQTQENGKDHYKKVGEKIEYKYSDTRVFPRIWDGNDPSHARFYRNYLELAEGEVPSGADNMKYFVGYQLGWMWWRYFMWNYAGRENDIEGQGNPRFGHWISGIPFIDKAKVGNLDLAGNGVGNNAARNELYFLPLILGLLGMVYHFNRNRKDGIVTFVLFFFTGIAICIYLNMTPQQPRERDYAFAGATYAFAIWIGLGVLMVNDLFQRFLKGTAGGALAIVLCLAAVPTLMAAEEWDDHDRSRKTLAHSTAYNALQSCAPNAILFTFGDNDTYPVWYLQEIEGVRRDVRIINLSLLGIDWYIDQLNYKINDADAVPMVWKKKDYVGEAHNFLSYNPNSPLDQSKYYPLYEVCQFMVSDDPKTQAMTRDGARTNFIPAKNFTINSLSKEQLVAQGLVKAADTGKISTDVRFTNSKNMLIKDDIAVLNIIAAIAQEGWKRPIYFGGGLPADNYAGLDDYLALEGVVYRLMPYRYADSASMASAMPGNKGWIDLDKTYDLYMNKYQWGNAERNDVYYDEKNRLMFAAYRVNVSRAANQMVAAGRQKEAVDILNKVHTKLSQTSYPYNPYTLEMFDASGYFMAAAYYNAGDKQKASEIANIFIKNVEADINWILSLKNPEALGEEARQDLSLVGEFARLAGAAGDAQNGKIYSDKADALYNRLKDVVDMSPMMRR